MKPGDVLEAAIWLDGRETTQQRQRFQSEVMNTLIDQCTAQRVAIKPLKWIEKKPGDERVPEVPDHIQGPDVTLLVAEAEIVSVGASDSLFLNELEPGDLRRLRAVTRNAYKRQFPGRERLTDRQCDTLISDLGPEAAVDALKTGRAVIQ